LRLNLNGTILEGKSIGSNPKIELIRRAPRQGPRQGPTQELNLLQMSPNWYLKI
jgi:hypothetical protein